MGRVLVVREDGRDITTHQVEAIAHYCQYIVPDLVSDCDEKLYHDLHADVKKVVRARFMFLKEKINRIQFEDFFTAFKKKKIADGDKSWVRSLYHFQCS